MAALTGIQQRELIELVQQHHPHMGETEVRKALNDAQREICEESGIMKNWFSITTVADTRFYDLDTDIFEVIRVEITDADGNLFSIPRLTPTPESGGSV